MDRDGAAKEPARIVQFRPRPHAARPDRGWSPVEDLRKYVRAGEDDYGHRMAMNLIAIAVVVVLIGCSIWLVDVMIQVRKTQDCVLTGQRNCVQIAVPANAR
jgi:hypothetical protein